MKMIFNVKIFLLAMIAFLFSLPTFAMMESMDREYREKDNFAAVVVSSGPTLLNQDLEKGQCLGNDLLENGYFVHLTRMNLFDKESDLKLRGGTVVSSTLQAFTLGQLMQQKTTYILVPDSFRPCIYFSLQCALSQSHSGFKVEERTQAVLIPVRTVLSKVVNFAPHDTAVWAPEIDLKITEGCILFTPFGKIPTGLDVGYITLQSYTGSLPMAVNNWLTENTGKCITLVDAPENIDNRHEKALLQGHDLLDPRLFDAYLRTHPWVSFGYEKTPKRNGFGPWLGFFHTFVEEFLRLYKYGAYKYKQVEPPTFVNKYRVEPLVAFAERGLTNFEQMLDSHGEKSIEADFQKHHKRKIKLAIDNLRNYAVHNTKDERLDAKKKYLMRPYSADLVFRLSDHPYSFVKDVLDDKAFVTIREEMESLYWLCRYTDLFHGVLPIDDTDLLGEMNRAAKALRRKTLKGKLDFFYVQLPNCICVSYITGPRTPEFKSHFLKGLSILSLALPKTGSITYHCANKDNTIDLKAYLNRNGLEVPEEIWGKGLDKLPEIKSPHRSEDAF